jgi:hypothetical protein
MNNIGKAVKIIASEATCKEAPNYQKIRLLEYLLKHGKIASPLVAWSRLGIYRLSAVVFDLRKLGIEIETELVDIDNQFGERCRVASYRLLEWQPALKVVRG